MNSNSRSAPERRDGPGVFTACRVGLRDLCGGRRRQRDGPGQRQTFLQLLAFHKMFFQQLDGTCPGPPPLKGRGGKAPSAPEWGVTGAASRGCRVGLRVPRRDARLCVTCVVTRACPLSVSCYMTSKTWAAKTFGVARAAPLCVRRTVCRCLGRARSGSVSGSYLRIIRVFDLCRSVCVAGDRSRRPGPDGGGGGP